MYGYSRHAEEPNSNQSSVVKSFSTDFTRREIRDRIYAFMTYEDGDIFISDWMLDESLQEKGQERLKACNAQDYTDIFAGEGGPRSSMGHLRS
jgi:hypothetical protein